MRYFYDSHFHMMNLSHPNLTAILRRMLRDGIKPNFTNVKNIIILLSSIVLLLLLIHSLFSLTLLMAILWLSTGIVLCVIAFVLAIIFIRSFRDYVTSFFKNKFANIMNLLAAMETDIGDCIIQMEEELRERFLLDDGLVVSGDGRQKEYQKIVLTPLIMDFGMKEYDNKRKSLKMRFGSFSANEEKSSKHPYKVRWKPIVAQVEDLCIGIRDYYRHRDKYVQNQDGALFQIIPFMGINTKNYSMKSHAGGGGVSMKLENILEDNFGGFGNDTTPQQRWENIDAIDWKKFNGDIESIGSYYFLGIKVYPPLGFDPWPEDRIEREKVCYLYQYCIDNNIPVTAHCNPGGFLVDDDFKNFSSPYKWEQVLDYTDEKNNKPFERLRLNLAHFGGADSKEWRKKIADMILKKDTVSSKYKYENLYTDISYQGVDKKSYDALKDLLDRYDSAERARLIERLIFGSDFMINLQDINSYSQYLDFFFKTNALTLEEKDMLCNKNAERFLYIG